MPAVTFENNYNFTWYQVYSNNEFVGYICRKDKYFQPVDGLDKLTIQEMEAVLEKMKEG